MSHLKEILSLVSQTKSKLLKLHPNNLQVSINWINLIHLILILKDALHLLVSLSIKPNIELYLKSRNKIPILVTMTIKL